MCKEEINKTLINRVSLTNPADGFDGTHFHGKTRLNFENHS